MALPFTHASFLDLFGAYNRALWPAVLALWIATLAVVQRWIRKRDWTGRVMLSLLAVHWAWSGVVYHWMFFRRINPAAAFFGGAFVLEAFLLGWLAVTSPVRIAIDRSPRRIAGIALVLYAVAYPLVGLATGLSYPRMPVFAVPCPTTILTAGVLLSTSVPTPAANVVPIVWAGIGGSAAFVLGIRADFALAVAGGLLAFETLAPRALGRDGGPA